MGQIQQQLSANEKGGNIYHFLLNIVYHILSGPLSPRSSILVSGSGCSGIETQEKVLFHW